MFLSESILQTWCIDFLNDFGGLHTDLHRDGDRWEERERGRATDMILELGTKYELFGGGEVEFYCVAWYRGAYTCPKWRGGRHIVFRGRILNFFYRFSLHIGGPRESHITFDSKISSCYLLLYFWGVLAAMLTKFETKSARVKGKGKELCMVLFNPSHACFHNSASFRIIVSTFVFVLMRFLFIAIKMTISQKPSSLMCTFLIPWWRDLLGARIWTLCGTCVYTMYINKSNSLYQTIF